MKKMVGNLQRIFFMKTLSLLSLSLIFFATSAHATISSRCTITKWKVMDALYTPSEATKTARVSGIEAAASKELARLKKQFCDEFGSLKDVASLVALYKSARYPYTLCLDYIHRAQTECDTQIQYLTYAATIDNRFLSRIENFVTLRNMLKDACKAIGNTCEYQAELAAITFEEQCTRGDDEDFLYPRNSYAMNHSTKSPSLSVAHSSSDLASTQIINTPQEPESNDYHGIHPDTTSITPW